MSVAAELAKPGASFEFILCIEGIGWPGDEFSPTNDFAGTVFATADINGDLTSLLGSPTVVKGLQFPISFGDSLDPRTGEYSVSGGTFEINDVGDVMRTLFRPHLATASVAALGADLDYGSTTVTIDETDATFAQNDVVWIADAEAIKLGSKTTPSPPDAVYSSSTRGHLGTRIGNFAIGNLTGRTAREWEDGTRAANINRRLWGRRVALYIHVPGEAATNLAIVYLGRVTQISDGEDAEGDTRWRIATKADPFVGSNREYVPHEKLKVYSDQFVFTTLDDNPNAPPLAVSGQGVTTLEDVVASDWGARHNVKISTNWDLYRWVIPYWYPYRWQAGGTEGVRTAIAADPTQPQTYNDTDYDYAPYRIDALMDIGGGLAEVEGARVGFPFNDMIARVFNSATGARALETFAEGTDVRLLLDNLARDWHTNRFAFNKTIPDNPLVIFLMFLLSMPTEARRLEADTSTTSTVIKLRDVGGGALTYPVTSADAGKALFFVEGTQQYLCRTILSVNTAEYTLDTALGGAPAAGDECQLRNSIYDVLPIGWGMGADISRVNVSAFETLIAGRMGDARIGNFALGKSRIDLWEVLVKNLLQPYGVYLYIDRSTGKLTPGILTDPLPDGTADTYTAITRSDIAKHGAEQWTDYAPVIDVTVKYRGTATVTVTPRTVVNRQGVREFAGYEEDTVTDLQGGGTAEMVVTTDSAEAIKSETAGQSLAIDAMWHTSAEIAELSSNIVGIIERSLTPPVLKSMSFMPSQLFNVYSGAVLSMTDNETGTTKPINPFTGSRGWTSVLGRVMTSNVRLSEDEIAIDAEVELVQSQNGALIAPAASVTSKGSDGGGDYFSGPEQSYVIDQGGSALDTDHFVAGDLIELRNADGSQVETHTIDSVVQGTATTNYKIYVTGTIVAAITAGDYVTFQSWSASNTANMVKFSAMADANETLGAGNDAAKVYA